MDSWSFKVEARGTRALVEVLRLALVDPYSFHRDQYEVGKKKADQAVFAGWGETEEQGERWLLLFGLSGQRDTEVGHLFLSPMSPEALAPMVQKWIMADPPSTPAPDLDGSVEQGAFEASAGWEVRRVFSPGVVVAFRRRWATYHK